MKPITNYQLPITHYQLPITNYPLPITHYQLPITHYPLPITSPGRYDRCANADDISDICARSPEIKVKMSIKNIIFTVMLLFIPVSLAAHFL
ncbi:MAG: hypothetical protein ACKPEQ_28055, partial [Dolichospermum sp.]